ncbi:uncharacterized protein LOC123199534 [Mangifera indica]|uniref:uncharacterized protein LOC123199534 n=1 Tax=Mangifera indica TaxID=29780 RepID=UPI001CFA13F9|nr:uncharacterized protein LOC123199534 [Mangifera indica]
MDGGLKKSRGRCYKLGGCCFFGLDFGFELNADWWLRMQWRRDNVTSVELPSKPLRRRFLLVLMTSCQVKDIPTLADCHWLSSQFTKRKNWGKMSPRNSNKSKS